MMSSLHQIIQVFAFLALSSSCRWTVVESFTPPSVATTTATTTRRSSSSSSSLFMSEVAQSLSPTAMEEDDDDEMEWVEEEFELLTERDFYNTEWKIGTLMENKPRDPKSIDTTWVRLLTTENGDNQAIWGDDSKGKWTIDVPSQFFSISKETFGGWFGKQIWAGTIEDFYYLEGTVRGWSPISPASVDGQWQGVRLGVVEGERVTKEERGEAPWFMMKEEEDEDGDDLDGEGEVEGDIAGELGEESVGSEDDDDSESSEGEGEEVQL